MSKVEGGEGQIEPPPLKASCNYFFLEASRVNKRGKDDVQSGRHLTRF